MVQCVRIEVLKAVFLRIEVFWDLKLCLHIPEDLNSQTHLVYGIAALKHSSPSLSKVSFSRPFLEAQHRTTELYEPK